MKSNEMPNISNTLQILYTALFIRLFSILNTDLLGSVTSIPYNSAGRQKDLTNVTETSCRLYFILSQNFNVADPRTNCTQVCYEVKKTHYCYSSELFLVVIL